MQYLVLGRIGPMEEGERKGTYLEAGEFVTAEFFKAESIPLLEAAQVLRAATAEEIANGPQQVAEVDSSALDTMTRRKRAAKKSLTEDDDGTHNGNGD